MSLKTRNIFATFGYVRSCSNQCSIQIPIDIIQIIVIFYGRAYKIYANGYNHRGEWGMGRTDHNSSTFIELKNMSKLVQDPHDIYYCGGKIFIRSQDTVYAAGDNAFHRLGIQKSDTQIIQFEPVTFSDMMGDDYIDIISTTHDAYHTLFITKQKKQFYGIGRTADGALAGYINLEDKTQQNVETLSPIFSATKLFETDNVSKIECGTTHTLFLTRSGNVFGCGCNSSYECGLVAEREVTIVTQICDHISDISVGDSHNLCLSDKGELYVFGDNVYQQLGVETIFASILMKCPYFKDNDVKLEKIRAGGWHNIVMDDKGICWGFGWSEYAQLGQIKEAYVAPTKLDISIKEDIENIYCGPWHSALLTKTNKVYTFGYNGNHECCTTNHNDRIYPPHHLTRAEIGVDKECRIATVIMGYQSSLIIIED